MTARRKILGVSAAALAAGAIGATMAPRRAEAASGVDAELVAACNRFTTLERQKRRLYETSGATRAAEDAAAPALDAIHAEQREILGRVYAADAQSWDGLRARLRMAREYDLDCFSRPSSWDDQMIRPILEDLAHLLGV